MNRNLYIGIAVLVLAAGAYFLLGNKKITNYPPHQGPIVAFGDSLVTGVGSSDGKDFVSLLSKGLGEQIINIGKSGDTTATALERIDELLDLKPRLTLVVLGGNDFLNKAPQAQTFDNLRNIVEKIQSSGSIVVLVGVRSSILKDTAGSAYKELAAQTGSVYVSDILSGIFGDSRYMWDYVHPNDKGYEKIAKRLLPIVKKYSR
jgi:acyl-CoA thioesterase I